ncbi:MAG: nucleotidyltransferase domain-containing protein [Candidatus Diapherotrites archaeon]|nr:nucleotidyltransferase domain-containing protein [Candidatus Diapherotrites archaeon]
MVQIYSWQDLEKGNYSSRENLETARKIAISLMQKLHERGWIESATIFGSIARKEFSLGSDLDVLIISKPEKQALVEKYLTRVFKNSVENLKVKPEITHMNSKEARSGYHSLSPLMFKLLKSDVGKKTTVGTDPRKLVRIRKLDLARDKESHLAAVINAARKGNIMRSFDKAHDRPEYYQNLQFAIDRVINNARHILDMRKALPKIDGKTDYRKSTVVRVYAELFKGSPAAKSLQRIAEASANYQNALRGATESLKNGNAANIAQARQEYEKALSGIERIVPDSTKFFEANARLVGKANRPKPIKRRILPRLRK